MTRPKAIVFDLGKVLVDFDYGIAAQRIAERSGKEVAHVRRLIEGSPAHVQFETGHLDQGQFFEAVRQGTDYPGTQKEFADSFADIFAPIEGMIGLHARLNGLGYPTYIFSNTNEIAVAHIRRNFPFFSHFKAYVYSFEHRSMKPEARLYEVVESVTGCSGEEILYLDDRPENAVAGRDRKWRVIHHQSTEATLDQCESWDLVPR